ncbi:MAG TPA: fibronectin type III domain-containing protein [Prolixibacteraceae bacterium]|nr:fibronectin type III domain-containing protein [Prolixibacteraceae bacterium]
MDTLIVDRPAKQVRLKMNETFSYIPYRPENVSQFNKWYQELLGRRFSGYTVSISSMGKEISELIPNIYRDSSVPIDSSRLSKPRPFKLPLIRNISKENDISAGLNNRNIAMWHSHGWYYNNTLDRWQWQRPRLFMSVEDILSMSFVVPYIVPMLENAGATVFLPRERDTQKQEIIIDKDGSTKGSMYLEKGEAFQDGNTRGFALKVPFLTEGENPFQMGTTRKIAAQKEGGSSISYIPEIPETGNYAVYISYALNEENVTDAHYTICHAGGKTSFLVNQTMGGGTWIYLGTFLFEKGSDRSKAMVELTNQSEEKGRFVSADAVKIGGGMGNVVRGKTEDLNKLRQLRKEKGEAMDSSLWMPYASQRPRYQEGARYYLQYAGMPDSLVYSINEKKSDYKDDYQSRGEWVNYLMGAPNGPSGYPLMKGLGIPIDMALAFHTDAGITPDSSIIGSLVIYNTTFARDTFPNGQSKWASRDLADIIQTQILEDLQKLYEPQWTRRGMWNKEYSEAVRPKVPTVLTEFISHQNFADILQASDPRFKFDVGRAYYKGILRFISSQNGTGYVLQPLPVDHFSMSLEGRNLRLSWQPVTDPLEPTAVAKSYKIYTRIENGGFDNGRVVAEPALLLTDLKPGTIYSFKATALNEGGESFPSEILSCNLPHNDQKPVLIVNAFDRISAPEAFDNGKQAGFLTFEDEGVAYHSSLSFVGEQYDFDRKSVYKDDDAPGFGASHADQEVNLVQGNTFDYPIVHGQAIRNNGLGFISMSDEAFKQKKWDENAFAALDIIFGEEKTTKHLYGIPKKDFTLFDAGMREAITAYLFADHARIFLSGAYIGTDLDICCDSLARKFAGEVLHYRFLTNHASKSGSVYPVNAVKEQFTSSIQFNQGLHPSIYKVESPDAIESKGKDAKVLFRYKENNKTAGVGYDGNYRAIVLGFPFETIVSNAERDHLMGEIIKYWKMDTKQ